VSRRKMTFKDDANVSQYNIDTFYTR